jgi:hypothetical protein
MNTIMNVELTHQYTRADINFHSIVKIFHDIPPDVDALRITPAWM